MSEDLAWLAGLFEGEGTLTISSAGIYTRPIVTLEMTDASVVQMFHARWPGVTSERQAKGNARPSYCWRLQTGDGVRAFLADLAPHFRTERVKAKAALLSRDVEARVQGSREADYLFGCRQRARAMRLLNHRGTTQLGETA